jgi:pentatricopeptide repeat protein
MSRKIKPEVCLSRYITRTDQLLGEVMSALKKVGRFEDAEKFYKLIKQKTNIFEAVNVAKRYVKVNFKGGN